MIRPVHILPIVFLAFLSGAVVVVRAHRAAPVAAHEARRAVVGSTPREAWAVALLGALGNAQPTPEMVAGVVAWSIAEDGGGDALARNNPWNTTMCGYNMLGSINSDGACGVGHYATFEDGIAANAATLQQSNFADVRAALLANDVEGFKRALWASQWAASRYNGGVDWPKYQLAQTRKCLPTATGAISAHFTDTSSGYWAGQSGGMHNGTDYAGRQGEPVFAPFDLTVEDIQYYADPGRIGWYVQGRLADGYLFYAGHLGTVAVRVGEQVPACAQIGTIGEVAHTHLKIASPDKPAPCEASGCDDFELYWSSR